MISLVCITNFLNLTYFFSPLLAWIKVNSVVRIRIHVNCQSACIPPIKPIACWRLRRRWPCIHTVAYPKICSIAQSKDPSFVVKKCRRLVYTPSPIGSTFRSQGHASEGRPSWTGLCICKCLGAHFKTWCWDWSGSNKKGKDFQTAGKTHVDTK